MSCPVRSAICGASITRRQRRGGSRDPARGLNRRRLLHPAGERKGRVMPRQNTEADFWKRVEKGGGCWEWKGSFFPAGYGKFGMAGKKTGAHRAAWLFAHGEIPSGLLVCHTCDNRKCVRPDHLFLGTHKDNGQDASRKGRLPTGDRNVGRQRAGIQRGENNGYAKMKESWVVEARRRRASGETLGAIAKDYGVAMETIFDATSGRTWKHLPLIPPPG